MTDATKAQVDQVIAWRQWERALHLARQKAGADGVAYVEACKADDIAQQRAAWAARTGRQP